MTILLCWSYCFAFFQAYVSPKGWIIWVSWHLKSQLTSSLSV